MVKTQVVTTRFKRGDVIGDKFEVVRKLGEGGCGAVYRCRDLRREGSEVAIKILEDMDEFQRFRREAKVIRQTESPHVVRYLGRGRAEGANYLVMEFVDGGSLKALMDKRGRLPAEEAAWVVIQTIQGLKHAGTVHRDLKPENLLLTRGSAGRGYNLIPGDTEKGAVIKVADFGLAKSPDGDSMTLTRTGQVMGTPVYMSPEQCRNTKRVGVKSDIYSLGVLLYEMVSGRVPFDANNVYDIMEAHCHQEPKLGHLPAAVRPIVARCMEKEPGKRYPSLAALERDLANLAGIRATGGGSGWWFIALAALILAGLIGAGYYFRAEILTFVQETWASGLERVGQDS